MHIRRGDRVVVIAGEDKGSEGKVLKVFPHQKRVIVENVSFVRRATRANPSKNQQGGLIEKEAPIHVSNVMLLDPRTGEPTRIYYRRLPNGKKVRISKKSKEEIPTND
ncbi:MAG: 50S ribosomal protein L24 [Candidatus Cloacimonetes bacterium 4572_55]|nr:MAG: 50S ribosomal protein L24 [Candidatus Cloacimonetes bacterium 4572_55]